MAGKKIVFLTLGLALALLVISPSRVLAQNKLGEIININYKYRIAFADLTQRDVQTGDKVAVKNSDDVTVYLEAVEVYPVMVKLSITSTPGYELSDDQFAKIAVGSHVNVVDQAMFKSLPASSQPRVPGAVRSGAVKHTVRADVGKDTANFADISRAGSSDQERPMAGQGSQPEAMRVYDPNKITARVETGASSSEPSLPPNPETVAPVGAPAAIPSVSMDYKVAMLQQKVDKLVDSNLAMADQITMLLKDKASLEELLKDKDRALTMARNQVLDISNTSKPQDKEIKDLQKQLAKLGEEKIVADKEILDLNQKIALLKKKLARMIDLLNKHTKTYE